VHTAFAIAGIALLAILAIGLVWPTADPQTPRPTPTARQRAAIGITVIAYVITVAVIAAPYIR
jgi:cytochrome b561